MTVLAKLRSMLERIFAATRVATAVENRMRPHPTDLRRLGIDPHAFTSLGHG